jgi:hypothetical protein
MISAGIPATITEVLDIFFFNYREILKQYYFQIDDPYVPNHFLLTTRDHKVYKSLWRCYINTIVHFLEIIHHSVLLLFKNNVSETGICLRPQVKSYSAGPNRQNKSLPLESRTKTKQDI